MKNRDLKPQKTRIFMGGDLIAEDFIVFYSLSICAVRGFKKGWKRFYMFVKKGKRIQ